MEKEKEKREQSENNEGKNCDKDLKERRKKKILSLNLTPSVQISLLCVFPENIYQVPKQEAGVWSVLQQQMY